jgi:hypothetical protein
MCIDHSSVTSRVKYPGYSFRSRHEGRDCPPKRESRQMLGVNGIDGGRVSWRRLRVSPTLTSPYPHNIYPRTTHEPGFNLVNSLALAQFCDGHVMTQATQPLVNTISPPHWLSVPVCFVPRSLDVGPSPFAQVPKSNALSSTCASEPALI